MPASAEALMLEATLRKLVVHLEDVVEDKAGFEFDSSFMPVVFRKLVNGKLVSSVLGPGHL